MKEENINFDLINEIYKEIKETKEIVKNHDQKFEQIDKRFDNIEIKLEEHDQKFEQIDKRFDNIEMKLEEHAEQFKEIDKRFNSIEIKLEEYDKNFEQINKQFNNINTKLEMYDDNFKEIKEKFNSIDNKLETIEKKVDTTDKIERLHFEFTRNKFERLDQKIDTRFKYLDDKIENNKKKMISEITDLFEIFSVNTSRLIENLEKKIETEMRERKTDISKLEGLNDYDKIILGNLESRISILEEESEKYTI